MMTNWKETTWGKLATLEYGKALRDYKEASGPYRVYGTNGAIGWHTEPLYSQPSVIIGRKGAYRGVHFSNEPFYVIDTAFYLKPKIDLDMKWAYYQLLTQDINGMDSGSAIPSTSRDSFYQLPVLLPPIKEQKRIAEILGSLDDKIELNRKQNETLEGMARAVFQSWFVDFDPVIDNALAAGCPIPDELAERAARRKHHKTKPPLPQEIKNIFPDRFEPSPLGPIPKGWKVSTMGMEFDLTMGQSPPGESYNETGEGVVFYQGRRDFGFRFPTPRVFCSEPKRFAEKSDTLISVRAPVGDVNMANEKCCIGRGVAAARHKSGSRSYTYYMMHHQGDAFKNYDAEGTVFGSISKKDFENMKCLRPDSIIIKVYEEKIFAIDEQIETNEQESKTLTQLRDSLLPKLLTGEIEV